MSVDLSTLAPPALVESLNVAAIVAELKSDIVSRDASLGPALELQSEPLTKLVEAHAYRETLLRERINAAGRGALLAFATASTLDHLGALVNTVRLRTQVEDGPDLVEADASFRARIQTAFERLSTAGPKTGYEAIARAVDLDIADVSVTSPAAGEVLVTVLAKSGGGVAGAALLQKVERAVNADSVRPLTDQVTVLSAVPVEVDVEIALEIEPGPDAGLVVAIAGLASFSRFPCELSGALA
jgi:phage-related baseplate assembly protein